MGKCFPLVFQECVLKEYLNLNFYLQFTAHSCQQQTLNNIYCISLFIVLIVPRNVDLSIQYSYMFFDV